jgi:cytochrome c-type biogenesis protein CcmF
MIVEFALFALILSFSFATLQCLVPAWGLYRHNTACIKVAIPCAIMQTLLLLLALTGLVYAFLTNDFSIRYVMEHSATLLPWYYQMGAVWGGHEGSFLLWITLINSWGMVWLFFNRAQADEWCATVLAIMGGISAGFLYFLIKTSNPFLRNYVLGIQNGSDLNPLLQDPGLLIHPPILYFGYVGFVMVFALALTGLIRNQINQAWARLTRPWAILAWMMLTLGIILGSWWAYHVLGWGGWWFWDPVENAALLPWLVATALVHSLIVTERTGALKSWTLLLAMLVFVLCIVGTFLVRSGILVSVHTFANDPSRGMLLLILVAIVSFSAFSLYAWRAPHLQTSHQFQLVSRESCLLGNNLLLLVLMATVMLGTLYPVVIQIFGSTRLSVGAPYFNSVFVPLSIPLIVLMGIAPDCYWTKTDLKKLFIILKPNIMISLVMALILNLCLSEKFNIMIFMGCVLAMWLLVSTSTYYLRFCWQSKRFSMQKLGMSLAHIGVAIMIFSITVVSHLTQQVDMRVSLGEQFPLGKFQFTLEKFEQQPKKNYETMLTTFKVNKNKEYFTTMTVEQRQYAIARMAINTVSIKATLFYDLYLVLGEHFSDDSWGVRVYYKPMIRWIWFGGILLLFGGLASMVSTRRV